MDYRTLVTTRRRDSKSMKPIMHEEVKGRIMERQGPLIGVAYSKWFGRFEAENLAPEKKVKYQQQQQNLQFARMMWWR